MCAPNVKGTSLAATVIVWGGEGVSDAEKKPCKRVRVIECVPAFIHRVPMGGGVL